MLQLGLRAQDTDQSSVVVVSAHLGSSLGVVEGLGLVLGISVCCVS